MTASAPGYRLAGLYDLVAAPWEATVGRQALARVRFELASRIPRGGSILDVGAGTGRSTRLIVEHAAPARVVAVEPSGTMLKRARRRLDRPCVELRQAEATALPFEDESFDAVLMLWLLETLADPLPAVAEALRVLRPEGRVIAAFSARPRRSLASAGKWLMQAGMRPLFAGRFLEPREQPLHACTMECLHRHECGFTAVVTFGKRCQLSVIEEALEPA